MKGILTPKKIGASLVEIATVMDTISSSYPQRRVYQPRRLN
jgi:hypothetical protein